MSCLLLLSRQKSGYSSDKKSLYRPFRFSFLSRFSCFRDRPDRFRKVQQKFEIGMPIGFTDNNVKSHLELIAQLLQILPLQDVALQDEFHRTGVTALVHKNAAQVIESLLFQPQQRRS